MADVGRDGWRIHHEVLGPADGRPVVLISGLGEQIGSVEFPEEHCLVFADVGWRVVRLDNRDSGLSVPDLDPGPPDWPAINAALARGEQPQVPYALATLADDVIAVLDDLGVDAAALVGASMGAAVARWAAIRHPERIQALMVVMGASGAVAGDDGPTISGEVETRLTGMAVRRKRPQATHCR